MTDMDWLLCASIAVWVGLGGYITFVACVQGHLNRRLERLEALRNDTCCK